MERAYNDSQGVTEQFVRNGLTAANRDLGADFAQERFVFDAHWDAEREWMDIGFNATEAHTVHIAELEVDIELAANERLRLEVSSKFRRDGIEAELADAGLHTTAWWTDDARRFALLLATG